MGDEGVAQGAAVLVEEYFANWQQDFVREWMQA